MTIVDFYKKLSRLLTDTREKFLSHREAEKQLKELLQQAEKNGIQVKIDKQILDPVLLMRLDDEKSFAEQQDDYYDTDSSYDFENSF